MTTSNQTERIHKALDTFVIELPSWGFANTGTRFGKFIQASAATTTEEKLADAGQVHHFTGCCPSVATHVLWDFPEGLKSTPAVMASAAKVGVRLGAINPNVFQDQIYKNGSLGNPDPAIRKAALDHILESIEIGKQTGSRDVSLWFADGSSYPGSAIHSPSEAMVRRGPERNARAPFPPAADAGGIQAVRAVFLPHGPGRLGHVTASLAPRRPPSESVGGYGSPLSGAEYRTDCGVAAERGHAGWFPLQRPPLRGRRLDARFHRPLSGFPHLQRSDRL